jgi:molybdate transport system substrate-binding protein
MIRLSAVRFSILVLLLLLWRTPSGIAQDRVLVFAAASTREAVEAVLELGRRNHGLETTASFASSAVLARQIISGAPAHIYISANTKWMDQVENARLIEANTRQNLIGNGLVVIAPLGHSPLKAPAALSAESPVLDWLADGRLAIADPTSVPAGIYARQSLETLGLWQAVKDHLAPSGDVRAALALVERDAVPLGIVYSSDAKTSSRVALVADISPSSHPPIVYPIALTRHGAESSGARSLMQLFLSPEGQAAFTSRGFLAID